MTDTTYPYQTATREQRQIGAWWWCVHHEILCEPLTEPTENRVRYILEEKPEKEHHRRLVEFRPVLHPERLPVRLVEAWDASNKARDAYFKVRDAYVKAWGAYVKALDAYFKALSDYEPELMALHREEYPGTAWDGKSIFPGGRP